MRRSHSEDINLIVSDKGFWASGKWVADPTEATQYPICTLLALEESDRIRKTGQPCLVWMGSPKSLPTS